ncbi:MAG: hypothetical protein GEU71_00675 [Actinobacteria bacterium]|nr:hypothetical protein [Actinomycetota bacterium]
MKRLWVGGLLLCVSVSMIPSGESDLAYAGSAQGSPLLDGKASEVAAIKGNGYLAWRERRSRDGGLSVYVRSPKGDVRKVNRPGTGAALGGIKDGVLVYQEFEGNDMFGSRGKRAWSQIRAYDLREGTSRRLRAIDKKNAWEYLPDVSGNRIVFGRLNFKTNMRHLMVYDTKTGETQTIRSVPGFDYISPGQINGDFVTWIEWDWDYSHFSVLGLWDASDGSTEFLGDYLENEAAFWASSVLPDGTVYAFATGKRCGRKVRMVRFSPSDALLQPYKSEILFRLPRGFDSSHTFAFTNKNEKPVIYYEKVNCRRMPMGSDIYRMTDPQ